MALERLAINLNRNDEVHERYANSSEMMVEEVKSYLSKYQYP